MLCKTGETHIGTYKICKSKYYKDGYIMFPKIRCLNASSPPDELLLQLAAELHEEATMEPNKVVVKLLLAFDIN